MKNINGLDARIGLRNIVRIVRITSVLSFVALCGATVVPIYHETNNAEAATGIATAPTLTFTSTNATASVSLSVNDIDGTFATSTEAQKAAFSIATNNCSGYTLNLTASGNTTTLNDDNSHAISSIEYDVSATDFASDTSLNNKWGFIPSHYSSAANTDDYYFPASTGSHSDTLMVTSIANSNNGIDNADNYTIGIGLRADYNIPSGIYTNSTFLIQYVVNPVDFSITYSDDDIAGVGNLPLMQGGSAQGGETIERVTLSLAIPTRTGYTFVGWCLGVLSDNGTTCTGTTFAAGAEFGIDKTTDNSNIILKALWTVGMGHTMQEFAAGTAFTTCSAMNIGDTITLLDARDGQSYTVGKLADGANGICWMTENLNLAGGTVLSAENTDVTSEYINGFTASGGLTKDNENNTITLPASSLVFSHTKNAASVYNSNNKTNCGASGQDIPCYSYYSWPAATLGGKLADGQHEGDASGYNAAASICPKGWKLPTSTISNASAKSDRNWKTGDWYALATAYGANLENSYKQESSSTFYNNAGPGTTPNFLLAGIYLDANNSFYSGGRNGYYWSATADPYNSIYDLDAYELSLGPEYISVADKYYRTSGASVRCMIPTRHDVVISMDSNTASVTLDSNEYGSQTVTTNVGTVSLREGVTYTITASFINGYEFSSWSNTASSVVSDTSSNPTTYTITGDSALAVASRQKEGTTFDEAYELAGKTKYNGYYTMQDGTSAICASVGTGQTGTLIDTRDSQIYSVGKLADNRCWMIENLNLAGGTALSAGDTDVTSEYIDGFATGGNLTKTGNAIILPASATKNSDNNKLTDSSQFSDDSNAYVFNSNNKTNCGVGGQNTPCYSYYSYIAATLGGKQADGATAETRDGYNAAASICPKNWKLPTSTTSNARPTTNSNWKTGDWYALATAYGVNLKNSYRNYDPNSDALVPNIFYDKAGPGATPNFLVAGYYSSGSFYDGDRGRYWSATLSSSAFAYTFVFSSDSGAVNLAYSDGYGFGHVVRCLLSD